MIFSCTEVNSQLVTVNKMGTPREDSSREATHLSSSRLEQLADARSWAMYARRKRQRVRLEQELREINQKISEFEASEKVDHNVDASAAAEQARRVAQERCSAAGRAMRECQAASRGQKRAEREALAERHGANRRA